MNRLVEVRWSLPMRVADLRDYEDDLHDRMYAVCLSRKGEPTRPVYIGQTRQTIHDRLSDRDHKVWDAVRMAGNRYRVRIRAGLVLPVRGCSRVTHGLVDQVEHSLIWGNQPQLNEMLLDQPDFRKGLEVLSLTRAGTRRVDGLLQRVRAPGTRSFGWAS